MGVILASMSVDCVPRGGGTLIFSYICRLRPFFVFKILKFNILGFSEKRIVWGYAPMVKLWIFLGQHKAWSFLDQYKF